MRERLLAALAVSAVVAGCGGRGEGVVVTAVDPAGAAARAGVVAGDRVQRWSRAGEGGDVTTPFALGVVEVEQAPRGAVTLSGRRGWRAVSFALPPGPWGVETRPAGVAAAPSDARAWEEEARHLAGDDAAWALVRAGRAFLPGAAADAKRVFEAAHAAAAAHPERQAVADDLAGDALRQAGALADAEAAYRRALAAREATAPRSLAVAMSRYQLGRLARRRGDQAGALDALEAARALRAELAPDSPELALALFELGSTLYAKGQLAEADALLERAQEIQERRVPDGLDLANTLSARGGFASQRSEFARAEALHRRALAITERLAPQGVEHAYVLNRLGVVTREQGDLDEAEAYHRRALALFEAAAPGSVEVAGSLNNLGLVAQARRDWSAALDFHRRALAIRERLNPQGNDVAASLNNLGAVMTEREEYAAAEEVLRRALAIKEKNAPGSLTVGASLHNLGEALLGQKRYADARRRFADALAVRGRLAPGSGDEATDWHSLGLVDREEHRFADALEKWRRALDIMDAQRGKLAGGDHAGFAARYAVLYRDTIALLVEQQRPAEAFAVRERLHARALLALLGERRQADAGTGELPPELDVERRDADASYDRAWAALGRLRPGADDAAIDAARRRLQALRDRRQAVAARIRQASPRLGALEEPQPVDLAGARAALDPGVALLAYAILRHGTAVFVVRAPGDGPGVSAFVVPLDEDALRARVVAFRGLIERGRASAALEPALLAQGERLYAELVRPAEPALAGARRILVSPDGPLHLLPFAALVRERQPLQFLAEWKPLPSVASATVYAEIKKTRRAPVAGARLVAFGDPVLGAAPPTLFAGRRTASGADPAWGPLPFSRDEVTRIAALFGGEARTYLGAAATEEQAKALGRDVRFVHFATHGLLDPRSPLDSALVLTQPPAGQAGENGLLQAWEVRDRLRLDADLVTLSACESALGREATAEGLIGLARAFQHAGARSVLASLWSVSDRSTAQLMASFYGRLRQGAPRDEALQAAQVESLRAGAHPYHWAAFQLAGDWQ